MLTSWVVFLWPLCSYQAFPLQFFLETIHKYELAKSTFESLPHPIIFCLLFDLCHYVSLLLFDLIKGVRFFIWFIHNILLGALLILQHNFCHTFVEVRKATAIPHHSMVCALKIWIPFYCIRYLVSSYLIFFEQTKDGRHSSISLFVLCQNHKYDIDPKLFDFIRFFTIQSTFTILFIILLIHTNVVSPRSLSIFFK